MYQNASNIIIDELNKIDLKIRKILSEYENFLTAAFIDYILNGSKKIRSTVAILTAKALGGNISDKQITVCAITEIIHNASLIHDDIIDNSNLRRGLPSFNKTFGNSTAILAGDFLISVILNELLKLDNKEVLNRYIRMFSTLCLGEINQIGQENQIISVEEYIDKTEKKTAELFKTILFSIFTVENQHDKTNIAEQFGKDFGIAFQIKDDIFDFAKKSTNKPVLSDINNGISTLPIILYAEKNGISNFEELNPIDIQNGSNIKEANKLCMEFSNNALDLIKDFSDNQYTIALKNLCKELQRI